MIKSVILCGGSGTRLWPISRTTYPKQFLDLGKGNTLFKETILRAVCCETQTQPLVITNKSNLFYVKSTLIECNQKAKIIVEPVSRNTAPAIAAAAFVAYSEDNDANLLVMPADHKIDDISAFKSAVEKASILADNGYLVTFELNRQLLKPDLVILGQGRLSMSFAIR